MCSAVVDLGPGRYNMQWCSFYFDWVRVGLPGIQLTPAVGNASAIYQINLFPLDTAVVFFFFYTGYQIVSPIYYFP